jgi:DNA-binding CsgD family transcriptional regulator
MQFVELRLLLGDNLTQQEKAVLHEILEGRSNKEIAAALFISLSTVKSHINSIYKKLGVNSRKDLKTHFRD